MQREVTRYAKLFLFITNTHRHIYYSLHVSTKTSCRIVCRIHGTWWGYVLNVTNFNFWFACPIQYIDSSTLS
jgi:hypothetical protein